MVRDCLAGYTAAENSSSCMACPAGKACPNADPTLGISDCNPGTYSTGAQTECTKCPAGESLTSKGSPDPKGAYRIGWPLTWKKGKSGKSQGKILLMKKSGKSQGNSWKNCQSQGKVGKNVLENVDIAHFISIFCQVISVAFSYTADKLDSGKTLQVREKSGKIKTWKIMAPLWND